MFKLFAELIAIHLDATELVAANEKAKSKEATGEIPWWRMSALIDNVMDFARGRLGNRITLNRSLQSLEPFLVR
jgi:hypothetical protein